MDYKTIWNEICFHIKKNRGSTERDFQTTVEFIFEKLGWSQYRGEIVTQLNIPVGSSGNVRPDIVIKESDNIVLVVELKRAGADLSERNAEQLISYMRLLRLDYGILLGETMQIYSEMQHNRNMPIKICDISFIEDSETGIECIEVLSKNKFSIEKLDSFSRKCIEQPDIYSEIKKLKNSSLYSNNTGNMQYESRRKPLPSTTITIEGFEDKYRPKRLLPEIPNEFTRTGEKRDTLYWNGFYAKDDIWKMENSSERFVIKGKHKFQIFIVIGEDEIGRLKLDRYYLYGHTSSNYVK